MTDLIPTRVHNLIIVDESGSMECIRKQAFTGMNETLQTLHWYERNSADYPYDAEEAYQPAAVRNAYHF